MSEIKSGETASIQLARGLGRAAKNNVAKNKSTDAHTVWIEGGAFQMGSDDHYPEEAPAHTVKVDGFWIDKYPVTNVQFSRFFEATGHITLAERIPDLKDYPGANQEMLVPA